MVFAGGRSIRDERGVRVVFVGYGWCMGSIYFRLGLILSLLESELRNIK